MAGAAIAQLDRSHTSFYHALLIWNGQKEKFLFSSLYLRASVVKLFCERICYDPIEQLIFEHQDLLISKYHEFHPR